MLVGQYIVDKKSLSSRYRNVTKIILLLQFKIMNVHLTNERLDCSFYKDFLHLFEQGNVKLAKSVVLMYLQRKQSNKFSVQKL